MREKDFGIWHEISWSQLWDQVLNAAHGLLALGVDHEDVVSIHSEDRPEWVILDLASVAIRAISTGLYPTNPTSEVLYLLNNSQAVVHLAEDQEQVDKVLEAGKDAFPKVRKIIYVEPRGIRTYDDPRLMFWDDFIELGRQHREANGGDVEARMAQAESEDIMTLVYTEARARPGPRKGRCSPTPTLPTAWTRSSTSMGGYPRTLSQILRTKSSRTYLFVTSPSASSQRGRWPLQEQRSTLRSRSKLSR